jgi:hypothetical protein
MNARSLLAIVFLALSFAAHAGTSARWDKLEQTLKIRPEQKEQFDAAAGATQRAMLSIALSALQAKERLSEELMKARPDFNAFVELQDQVMEQNRPLLKEAREEWRKLYETLDDEQVVIAKNYLRNQLGQLLQSQIAP